MLLDFPPIIAANNKAEDFTSASVCLLYHSRGAFSMSVFTGLVQNEAGDFTA